MILFVAAAAAADAPPPAAELLQQAKAHRRAGRVAEAITTARQAVEAHRSIVGNDSPELSPSLDALASDLTRGGKREDALAIRREILRIATKVYGEKHFKVRTAKHYVAVAEAVGALTPEEYVEFRHALDRFSDACRSLEQEHDQKACQVLLELLPFFSDKCGTACEESRSIRGVVAIRLTGPDRNAVVADLVARDLKSVRIALGVTHPDYAKEVLLLAHAYTELGKQEECEKVCREVIDACHAQGCEDAATTGYLQAILFVAYTRAGRLEDADRVSLQYIDICRNAKEPDPMMLAKALEMAAFVASHKRDTERTIQYLEEAVSIQDSAGQRTIELATLKQSLGRAYWVQDDDEKAKRVLKQAVELFQATGGSKLSDARLARAALGAVYHETREFREAIPLLRETYLQEKKLHGVTNRSTRKFRDLLVDSLRHCGQNDEADELLREPRPFVVPAAAP